MKAGLQFSEIGGIENVELGFNLKELKAPMYISKQWTVAVQPIKIMDQVAEIEGTVEATFYFGLGPKTIARLGQVASRVVYGTTVTAEAATGEFVTVGAVGAGTVVAGVVAGALAVIAVTAGTAKVIEWAKEE